MAAHSTGRTLITQDSSTPPVLAVTSGNSHAEPAAIEACCEPKPLQFALPAPGSRRRRLWELETSAHCPVLGVCLPIELLRRHVARALPVHAGDDDYRQHCIAVSESKHRSVLAEALHKALEQRFVGALRQAAAARGTEGMSTELHTLWPLRTDARLVLQAERITDAAQAQQVIDSHEAHEDLPDRHLGRPRAVHFLRIPQHAVRRAVQ